MALIVIRTKRLHHSKNNNKIENNPYSAPKLSLIYIKSPEALKKRTRTKELHSLVYIQKSNYHTWVSYYMYRRLLLVG